MTLVETLTSRVAVVSNVKDLAFTVRVVSCCAASVAGMNDTAIIAVNAFMYGLPAPTWNDYPQTVVRRFNHIHRHAATPNRTRNASVTNAFGTIVRINHPMPSNGNRAAKGAASETNLEN